MSPRSSRSSFLLLLVLALVLAACGSGAASQAETEAAESSALAEPTDLPTPATTPTTSVTGAPTPTAAPTDTGTFPVSVDTAGGEITLQERPTSIVSLSPTATEMLFAIGAGDQVVAVDDQSNYPEGVPTTDLSGFNPNVEAIAGYEPDLVVVSSDSTEEDSLYAQLGELGIPVLLSPAVTTLEGAYDEIEQLGALTGNVEGADAVISEMQSGMQEIIDSTPEFNEPPTVYHELDPTFYTVTSDTFIGSIYEQLGVENIADAAQGAGEYPQLSAEFIVESDPDLIYLADTECCDATAETVAERPGWGEISAVENGNVIEGNDDIASRWGPRIVEFAQSISDQLATLEPVSS